LHLSCCWTPVVDVPASACPTFSSVFYNFAVVGVPGVAFILADACVPLLLASLQSTVALVSAAHGVPALLLMSLLLMSSLLLLFGLADYLPGFLSVEM
jgi:hypothetical protein